VSSSALLEIDLEDLISFLARSLDYPFKVSIGLRIKKICWRWQGDEVVLKRLAHKWNLLKTSFNLQNNIFTMGHVANHLKSAWCLMVRM
ncbi:hypothetical protein KI387_020410, partial [Taxus chinensis]